MDITITITDEELACLSHDLIDPVYWVHTAVEEKIARCYRRMRQTWVEILAADSDVGPVSLELPAFVRQVLAHPSYQNRNDRENTGN